MNCCKKIKISLFVFTLLCSLVFQIKGQVHPLVNLKETPHFCFKNNENQKVILVFEIAEGYHIQAHDIEDENLIPTQLNIKEDKKVVIGKPIFPEGTEFYLKGSPDTMKVYSGLLKVTVPIKNLNIKKNEEVGIKADLYYQACDDSKCYFPRKLNFEMVLKFR